jgi:hypothetical protein
MYDFNSTFSNQFPQIIMTHCVKSSWVTSRRSVAHTWDGWPEVLETTSSSRAIHARCMQHAQVYQGIE